MQNHPFTPISRQSTSRADPAPRSVISRSGTVVFWALCHFVGSFVQQIAEIFAPLCLVVGIGWAALPHVLSLLTTKEIATDPQARDVVNTMVTLFPNHLAIGQHLLTPIGLIINGLLLLALAALGSTIMTVAARKL